MASKADEPVEAPLTPEQIQNWRNAMIGVLGPYALIMPDSEVQRLRDDMQRIANEDGNHDE